MKEIILTNGKICLVDDKDFDELSQFNWYETQCGYAKRHKRIEGKLTSIFMHRVVINAVKGQIVDHINRNPLDNRKENLRISDKSTNAMNRGKQKNSTSGYKCVYHDKRNNTFDAYITAKGKRKFLGSYKTAIEAAKAYNEFAIKLHGEFANLNEV